MTRPSFDTVQDWRLRLDLAMRLTGSVATDIAHALVDLDLTDDDAAELLTAARTEAANSARDASDALAWVDQHLIQHTPITEPTAA